MPEVVVERIDALRLEREVSRARAGDRNAFALLYARFARMVHGIGLTRLTPSEADDLVQDAFVIALERLHVLSEPRAIGAWLAQIARNRCVDVQRERERVARFARPAGETGERTEYDPERLAEAHRLLRCILQLPDAYRETLVLRLVEGMSGHEIAEQVGLTPESVRVNLHRGMKLLRETL